MRLLLRAATVLALTRGGDGPFPTMAGEAVFDTRLRPVTDIAADNATPVALVYTGEERRLNREADGRPLWTRKLDLVIELAIGSVNSDRLKHIETDPELEALLDFFELEVEATLSDPSNPWSLTWRRLVRKIESWDSEPFRSAEQSTRYAVRQIIIACEINPDCLPQPTTDRVILSEPARLQVPYLAGLEAMILANPVFASTAALMTGARDRVQLPALKGVGMRMDYGEAAPPVLSNISMEQQ
ncbi:MAG: hypothetical protein AB7O57_09270 [Hyphomicrobiaceae bacterium]